MCRLVGWVAERPVSLRAVLGDAAVERFVDLSRFHGHGWGMAYRETGGAEVEVRRSLRAARDDEDFAVVVDQPATAALVHLRWATPGFGQSLADTHPFVADGWAMMHNGAIGPSTAVRGLLAPQSQRAATGTTDSENLFLAVLDELEGLGELDELDGSAVVPALARAMETVSDRGVAAGLTASSLNAMLLGPRGIYAVNWADVTKVPPIMLAAAQDDPSTPPYYDLVHRHTEGADGASGVDVIASSGFVSDLTSWTPIEPVSVFGIEQPGAPSTAVIRPTHPLCPVPG